MWFWGGWTSVEIGDDDDGELHFPAVVLSTWRQVAGGLPREGREDAIKLAHSAPCAESPFKQKKGNSVGGRGGNHR